MDGIRLNKPGHKHKEQLAWYKAMEDEGELMQIKDLRSLEIHLAYWDDDESEKESYWIYPKS